MAELNVFIEINGKQNKVGRLVGKDYIDTRFIYDEGYLAAEGSRAISVSLPLQKPAFEATETRAFFESLLPEGFSRKSVANWAKVDENDYVALLKHLGRECIGAIQIAEDERITDGGYNPVEEKNLISLAKEGATKSTEILLETHISLAGASGKVGLFYDEPNNKWYMPYGIAASTHIVKQSHVRYDHLVLNERLCMMTASKLGIEVPKSFIVNPGKGEDENILYATERYDRRKSENSGELSSPLRLHQEDFAQALGIPASEKYETENRHYLRKIFELINDYSSDPVSDGLKLWDRIIFNYLIGNTDAHIKNYSLLYGADLKSIRLAPAYDIVCTRIYGNRNDMSIMINGETDCTEITEKSFKAAAEEAHIGIGIAMQHFDYFSENLEKALTEAANELADDGYESAVELGKRIKQVSPEKR